MASRRGLPLAMHAKPCVWHVPQSRGGWVGACAGEARTMATAGEEGRTGMGVGVAVVNGGGAAAQLQRCAPSLHVPVASGSPSCAWQYGAHAAMGHEAGSSQMPHRFVRCCGLPGAMHAKPIVVQVPQSVERGCAAAGL